MINYTFFVPIETASAYESKRNMTVYLKIPAFCYLQNKKNFTEKGVKIKNNLIVGKIFTTIF